MLTKVELEVRKHGIKQLFSVTHAEKLLAIGFEKNGGWELPENSKFVYTKENGIRRKKDKRSDRATEQEDRDK